jgi:hypothetical protein
LEQIKYADYGKVWYYYEDEKSPCESDSICNVGCIMYGVIAGRKHFGSSKTETCQEKTHGKSRSEKNIEIKK